MFEMGVSVRKDQYKIFNSWFSAEFDGLEIDRYFLNECLEEYSEYIKSSLNRAKDLRDLIQEFALSRHKICWRS